ncbi:MAG: hypothetical protein ACREFP_20335 [Acetobacteraceae bacterium]
MTESETAAGPEGDPAAPPPAAPEGISSEPPRTPRHSIPGWLALAGFLILAAAIALSWFHPRTPPVSKGAELAALNGRIDRLAHQLVATETKLGALAASETKLTSTEQALAARPGAPDLAPIEARLAALEKRKPSAPDLGPIEARLAALENRKPPTPAPPTPTELAASLAPFSKQLAGLEKSQADLTERVGEIATRVDAIATQLDEVAKRAERSTRTARLAAAAVALEHGRPLGSLPGAPPPLARFATTAPPTLAALRLSFPAAGRAERAAARATEPGQSLVQRMKDRLGDLLTLREGNKVIVGNPAESALARAQSALDAGDLEAAVAALGTLTPPLAQPMQHWKDEASALLAARRALSRSASAD